MIKFKRIVLFATVVLALACSQAQARKFNRNSMFVEVVSDRQGTMVEYPENSRGRVFKSYIAVQRPGHFFIRVQNNNDVPVAVVIAVDGLNVISGQYSEVKPHEPFYVLGPRQTAEYSGFRNGIDREQRFNFSRIKKMYGASRPPYNATGVIAVAVYPEQKRRRYWDNYAEAGVYDNHGSRYDRPGDAPCYGERHWPYRHRTGFVVAKRPIMKKIVTYARKSTLCRKGIIPCRPGHNRPIPSHYYPPPDMSVGYAPLPPPPVPGFLRPFIPGLW